jgi:hypothetical protein
VKYKKNPSSVEQLWQVFQIISVIAAPIILYNQIKDLSFKEDDVTSKLRKLGL